MEAVAREAGVAKPTLYAYFPDKDAVFAAIVTELIDEVSAGFEAAMRGEDDVVARVGNALAAKYKTIARVLEGSPHADELYGEHERSAAAQFRGIEQTIEVAITEALRYAGVARARPMAQLLLAAAQGVARKATGVAEIGPAMRLLSERLLRPELLNR